MSEIEAIIAPAASFARQTLGFYETDPGFKLGTLQLVAISQQLLPLVVTYPELYGELNHHCWQKLCQYIEQLAATDQAYSIAEKIHLFLNFHILAHVQCWNAEVWETNLADY